MATVKFSFLLQIIFAILAIVALEVQCEEIIPGIPVVSRKLRFSSRIVRASNTCGTEFGPRCKDCRTLMNCLGKDPPVSTEKCSDKNPKTPYCVNNVCTASPDPNDPDCNQSNIDFPCTGEGYFPDPDNCAKYYICPGVNQIAKEYGCFPNYVYRSKDKICGKKINAADCPTVDCSKTPNEFGVYKTDPAYYYFCLKISETEKKTIMMVCLDSVNTEYDPAVGECTFRCKKEGKFVNVLDCKKFYTCYKVGAAWEVRTEECPPNYFFDPVKLVCVQGTCTPQVTTQAPATDSTEPSSSEQPSTSSSEPTTTSPSGETSTSPSTGGNGGC
ncbi:hypothetical protein DMENIID0001_121880 [Sergentomyia squamirostris]